MNAAEQFRFAWRRAVSAVKPNDVPVHDATLGSHDPENTGARRKELDACAVH